MLSQQRDGQQLLSKLSINSSDAPGAFSLVLALPPSCESEGESMPVAAAEEVVGV